MDNQEAQVYLTDSSTKTLIMRSNRKNLSIETIAKQKGNQLEIKNTNT